MVREMRHTEIGDIPVDWKLQTFEETFRILSNNTLPRADLNNRGGLVRNVHYGDILTRFTEVLNCKKDDIPYINDISLLSSSTQLLQDGDIIIADTAEDDTVGKVTEVYGLEDSRMVAGLHTIPCRVKKGDFASGWLGYYMNSHMYHDQIIPFITGIKVSSVSKSAIAETLIAIPPRNEQVAIVETLLEIDSLIMDIKRTLKKLYNFKKALLQAMFPKIGKTEPEVRIPGFTDAWEQCKIGDIAGRTYGGGTPKTSVEEYWDGEIPWIQSSNLSEHELFNVDIQKHITELGLQKSATQLVPKNSIAVVSHVGVGKLVFMPFEYTTSQDFISLSELKTESIFTCYALYKRLQKDLHIVQGSAIKGITKEVLLGKEITVPSELEQRKIGSIMQNLDNLITLHQCKLEKYENIKQGMMSELLTGKIRLV